MWSKLQSGTLNSSTAYQLGELYTELEYPEETTMVEPTYDPQKKGKGRPRGARNKNKEDAREKSHFEHMREELAQLEKSKSKSTTATKSRGQPKSNLASTSQTVLTSQELQSQPPQESQSSQQPIKHLGVNFGIRNIDGFWFDYIK